MYRSIFLLCAVFVSPGLQSADNLLRNSGFETRDAWYSRAEKGSADPDRMTYVTENPHAGKYCLRFCDNRTDAAPYLSQSIAVPPGAKNLRLTFQVRADQPHPIRAGILFNSGEKPVRFLRGNLAVFEAAKEWRDYQLDAPVPDGAATLDLLLCPTSQQYPETGAVWFDDVTLTVAAAPIAASPAEALGIDRPAIHQQDAPYAPADGSTVTQNPPSFVFTEPNGWRRGKFTYALEWSQAADFPAAQTSRLTGLEYHVNIPNAALAPGKWYWRYGIENQQGVTVWSKGRAFTVPADAPVLPWPDIDRVTARIDRGHPRLYLAAADLPAVRERAQNGDLAPLVQDMKKRLEPQLGKPLIPEPDFLPPHNSKDYLPTYTKVFRTTRPDQNLMNQFALYYLMTGDQKFGDEAKRRILHFFVTWNPEGSTSLVNNDEPAMSIIWWGLPAYDWTWDRFTPAERAEVERSMMIRMKQFYEYLRNIPIDAHPYNSHAIYYYQLMGRLALMLIPEHPEAKPYFDYSLRLFWTYLHPYATPDGGWSEGPGYGSWGAERLFRYVHIVRHTTGIDLMQVKPFFTRCGYFPLIGWPGCSRQTSFGDGASPASQADMLRVCAAMNRDPVFLKAGLDRNQPTGANIWAVLTDTAKLGRPDLSKLPTAWQFPSIGFVALRTDLNNFDNDVGLLFQSNPYGAVSHHHNCHNCFMLEAYGEPLAISSGYYDYYSSPHHDGWTRQTRARNGITVDGGKGQMRGGQSVGKVTRFEPHQDFDIVTGDASKAYDMLDTSLRTIVHVRPGIFVVRDQASAPQPHVFEYNLHGIKPGTFDQAAQTVTLKMPKAELKVLFLADRPWKVSSFDRFPIEPNRTKPDQYPEQWHFTAAAPEASRSLDLITVLMPYRTGEADRLPRVEKLKDGVRFHYADGHTATVRFDHDQVITEKGASPRRSDPATPANPTAADRG